MKVVQQRNTEYVVTTALYELWFSAAFEGKKKLLDTARVNLKP